MEAAGLVLQEEQRRREATADINHGGTGITIPHVAEIADQTCAAVSLHSRQKARQSDYIFIFIVTVELSRYHNRSQLQNNYTVNWKIKMFSFDVNCMCVCVWGDNA